MVQQMMGIIIAALLSQNFILVKYLPVPNVQPPEI